MWHGMLFQTKQKDGATTNNWLRRLPIKQGFTYQDISEDFTATGESVRPKGPEFATREEMEIP